MSIKYHLALATAFLVIASLQTVAKELEGERAAASTTCPSPEEARAKMTVPDGYQVRCWAHEPLVVNPVAMTWDARGRLWVVEAFEYPEGTPLPENKRPFGDVAKDDQYHPVPAACLPTGNQKPGTGNLPKDRVIILEDTDNDGEADKRTVFVEGLNLASAIICGDDGIYVGQQPHIIHFKDSNRDDKPDEWRVVLTGFGREDTHELVNSFTWGPDGWLYMTHGVFTNSKVRRPGQPESEGFKFDAGIGRARPVVTQAFQPARSGNPQAGKPAPQWEFEVFADGTSNPWGCDYDAAGNFFVSACVIDHFFHMAPGGIYVRQGGAPENPYSYELLPSIVTHRHFRAAYAGVQIYQGGVYPKDTWGHAFIGNIHDNAIHEEVLTPVGATFKCEPRRDFLRANDGWFRPVSTQTGPDGNLWIMDWCDKYPCYQNAKANPEGVDRERGRIWRVVYRGASWSAVGSDSATPLSTGKSATASPPTKPAGKSKTSLPNESGVTATALQDASRPTKDMNLSKLDTPALVKLLGDSNNWIRRKASRQLIERAGNHEGLKLHEYLDPLRGDLSQESALTHLWTLLSADDLAEPRIRLIAEALSPTLRQWAARSAGEYPNIFVSLSKFERRDNSKVPAIAEESEQTPKPEGSPPTSLIMELAADDEPSVRAAVAVAVRQWLIRSLTIEKDARVVAGRLASSESVGFSMIGALATMMKSSAKSSEQNLAFAIWQAWEPALAFDAQMLNTTAPLNSSGFLGMLCGLAPTSQPISQVLAYKSMRRLCDMRKPENLDLALDFLTKIKAHDVLLAHALDGLEKGQESGIIKPTKEFSELFAGFAKSDNADVRKHAQNLATLWGDAAAIRQIAASLLDEKTSEAQRIVAVQTLRKVKSDEVRDAFVKLLSAPEGQPTGLIVEVIRAAADAGGDAFIAPLTKLAASKDYGTQLAAFGALSNRADWTHAMLNAIAEKKISDVGFPVSVRRQLATSKDKAIRDHAFKVLGAWKESGDDIKALIAAKKKACLEGEPDLANGKILFTATCGVCHTFHGGGQKVGPELIGSGRSNLDALLANVIDPNQIIGNGYENFTITTKDNRTLAGRVTEDTPSHVKLLAIGGAETVVPRDQIVTSVNTHQSLMPMGFGNLPDAAFRDIVWYLLAPPEEGPLTAEKKARLSASIDLAPPAKPKGTNWRAIDWESISLWNPQWKVSAPDFERTPVKLAEYHGKTNVLLMHPFEDKKTPTVIERKQKIEPGKTKLHFSVAADDRGDWKLIVTVNGEPVKELAVDHENPRWKDIEIDLAKWSDKEVTIRLEGHPTGWSWEFGYWHGIELK